MDKQTFMVNDMNCNGCISTIRQRLESDERIETVDFKLSKKEVYVVGDLKADETAEIIRNAGFHPEEATQKKGFLGNLFSN